MSNSNRNSAEFWILWKITANQSRIMCRCSNFFIFTRPELIYLDQRCDTRICRSKSELFHNHTNGILEIKKINMQSCNAHVSWCLIFIATSTAQWQWINNGIPIASDLGIPPSVYKGNKSSPLPSPTCKSHREVGDGEFVSCLASLPIPNGFSWVHFQFNCYFAAGIDSPPSVYKGNRARRFYPSLKNPR